MFRMKNYAHANSYHRVNTIHAAAASPSIMSSGPVVKAAHTPDFAWEFGWSFDGNDWLVRRESQADQVSSVDKALALAG